MKNGKSYGIPKRLVMAAWKLVKKAGGGPGADGQTIEDFELRLKDNLYKLWNRMSSGTYFPSPVLKVEIPKKDGGQRTLGIPTVRDRVGQAVVKLSLEPKLDPIFHEDSYGYRPKRSAIDAVRTCRKRCFWHNWVLEVDIRKYFDTINHELLMKAVRHHATERWEVLYIARWLKAEVVDGKGRREKRERGTPQGGVISPLLANLYLHYAFDAWMKRLYPNVPFERYADDIIVHCRSQQQAEYLRQQLGERFAEVELELHPTKTRIVFCKNHNRSGEYKNQTFTFLGYDFQPRLARAKDGRMLVAFTPAVGKMAKKLFLARIRKLAIHRRTDLTIEELAAICAPVIRGWIGYFKHFRPSALLPGLRGVNYRICKWLRKKYRCSRTQSYLLLKRLFISRPQLFPHWHMGCST